ncbi:ABC transporter ATP-binding protein [Actinoplanes rectilineatus]|uniref:ABC transporter ATP-binding protein n=1 Tax=Actinoplanes rectilineatus TaxID=113571 RepID=UPI0005F2F5B2|nr:ABC transporter ATP-binding protein [Actinoplanes rectilineatus]
MTVEENTVLRTEDLRVAFGPIVAVDGVSTTVEKNTFTVLIGPNGCGKSTLLRTAGRLQDPDHGVVLLDGHPIGDLPARQVARRLGLLPQSPQAPDGLTVIDLVSRGRDPHRRWYEQWTDHDEQAVDEALRVTGLTDLAHRPVDRLSGGQRQRAWIAMALAQRTPLLLLDEPTTYLDVVHQLEILELLAGLVRSGRATVLAVLHDLNMAARYADRLIAVRDGRIVATGTPAEVITPPVLARVFDLEAAVVNDPENGRPVVLPRRRAPQ